MSKELKKTLKEARDALKAKDYTTCVKQCRVMHNLMFIMLI